MSNAESENNAHWEGSEEVPLLNYTTTIDVHKTLGEIQKELVSHGARKIMYDYSEDGHILALIFQIDTPDGFRGIKLPSNVEAVYEILLHESKCPKAKKTYEHAEQVAWRTIKDWIESQMAILEWNMVKMDEIFLPYMLNKNGQTFFEAYQLKQLGDGN